MSNLTDKKKELSEDVTSIETDLEQRIQLIKQKSTELLSVQAWVKQYPFQSVGIATLLGFIFSYKTNSTIGNSAKDLIKNELKKQAIEQLAKVFNQSK